VHAHVAGLDVVDLAHRLRGRVVALDEERGTAVVQAEEGVV
jgi:hypothetical protein